MKRLVGVLTIVLAAGCGGSSSPSPLIPSSVPAPRRAGFVEGRLTATNGPQSCGLHGPCIPLITGVFGAQVEISSDAVTVVATTATDDEGRYSLSLPVGTFTAKFSKPGYRDTLLEVVIQEGVRAILNPLLYWNTSPGALPQGGEWNIAGTVTDGLGQPVAFARASVPDPTINPVYASTFTDASGRFTLRSSVVPASGSNIVTVTNTRYVTQHVSFPCCTSDPVTLNIRIPRVVGVTLSGPTALVVTEAAPVTATIELDDGTRTTVNPMLLATSDAQRVRNSWQGSGYIEGVSPGTAFVSWSYYGVSGQLAVTVTP
jgi:hypothetical protein